MGLVHKENLLQSQIIVLLGQELVECDIGVHGPHIFPQVGLEGLWESSGSVMGGQHPPLHPLSTCPDLAYPGRAKRWDMVLLGQ